MIGEWIKQARSKRGLSQQQLADKSGFSKRAVVYWENEQKSITVANLKKVVRSNGCRNYNRHRLRCTIVR